MTSSVVDSSIGRRGHRLVYLVLVQSLLIAWLGIWAVEDYLNNIYVRAYVDGTIQASAWLIGLVMVVSVLGGVLGLMRHRSHGKSVELVLSGIRGPVSTPGPGLRAGKVSRTLAAEAAHPAPMGGSSGSSVASASAEFGGDLHPAVAALKAELSERRVSLGLMSATLGQQTSPTGAKVESQSAPVPDRPNSSMNQVPVGATPQLVVEQPTPQPRPAPPQSQPSTVVRPMPQLPFARPAQPMPMLGSGHPPVPPRPVQPMGLVRPPDSARPAGIQQPQPSGQIVPRNVSTVITGIMPVKKKDAENPADEKKQSSQ